MTAVKHFSQSCAVGFINDSIRANFFHRFSCGLFFLANGGGPIAIKSQVEAQTAPSKAVLSNPSARSPSQSNTLPQADRYSYLRVITSQSCAVIEFLRIEPSLGQGNQQRLITTDFGSPSEACYLTGSP